MYVLNLNIKLHLSQNYLPNAHILLIMVKVKSTFLYNRGWFGIVVIYKQRDSQKSFSDIPFLYITPSNYHLLIRVQADTGQQSTCCGGREPLFTVKTNTSDTHLICTVPYPRVVVCPVLFSLPVEVCLGPPFWSDLHWLERDSMHLVWEAPRNMSPAYRCVDLFDETLVLPVSVKLGHRNSRYHFYYRTSGEGWPPGYRKFRRVWELARTHEQVQD